MTKKCLGVKPPFCEGSYPPRPITMGSADRDGPFYPTGV